MAEASPDGVGTALREYAGAWSKPDCGDEIRSRADRILRAVSLLAGCSTAGTAGAGVLTGAGAGFCMRLRWLAGAGMS